MSLFPRSFIADPSTSFTPLFRLLDDFDQYSRQGEGPRNQLKAFTPKFDVKETQHSYELHGELPGIDQKDVEIEFTDAHTLTVKGRSERNYTSGTPPAGFIEGEASSAAIEDSNSKAQKATVEDEGAEVAKSEAAPTEEHRYWVSERSVGEFSRSFTFPARVDQDSVKASMKNGILSIQVPKVQKHEARKITIT